MKRSLFVSLVTLSITLSVFAENSGAKKGAQGFPLGPDPAMTPGDLCDKADQYRYPEKIKYCNRNVESSFKWEIIRDYEEAGYVVSKLGRENFKIDHLIPLCAGGSNTEDNLWPQHKSVYEKTDKLEELLCANMAKGIIKQRDAVELIIDVKHNLEKADTVEQRLRSNIR